MSPAWSQDKFIKAFNFAAKAHLGKTLPGSDLPYLVHITLVCMEVMALQEVEPMDNPDLALQCAALHDVVEDTSESLDTIREKFGDDVADGVGALTKIKVPSFDLCEYLKKIKSPPREIGIVKLADRITNLQPPPSTWTKVDTEEYLDESRVILEMLNEASPYMADRLKKKIADYQKSITNYFYSIA